MAAASAAQAPHFLIAPGSTCRCFAASRRARSRLVSPASRPRAKRPSAPTRARSSKIVIDATRQWPEEGGPNEYPEFSRDVLARHDPEIFDRIDAKWGDTIKKWG